MYLANEGRFIAFVPEKDAADTLDIMNRHSTDTLAVRIGTVEADRSGGVTMKSLIGASRIVDMFSGEQLPRIC
jgi:hydrogenase expression/formation protein HypE